MLQTYQQSGIHVVQRPRDKDYLQQRVRQLDRRLFIEMQMVLSGELVWCVMMDVGESQPPMCILEWRDETGEPIPFLSEGIVTEIERMMRRGPIDMSAIDEENRRLVQRHEQASSEAYQEIADDFARMQRRTSVIPRSAALVATRRRQRRKGILGGPELP